MSRGKTMMSTENIINELPKSKNDFNVNGANLAGNFRI